MTPSCIHGFTADQCAACRTCLHGLPAAKCGRCATTTAVAALRSEAATNALHRAEEHRGFEIYYVPELSGWRFRAPDDTTSPISYRSTFLARKAIDEIAAHAENGSSSTRSAKKSS